MSGEKARAASAVVQVFGVVAASMAIGYTAIGCGGGGGGGGFFGGSQADGTRSTATAPTASAPADGATSIPVTVTIRDRNGNAIANAIVEGAVSGKDTTVTVSGVTNASGVTTVDVTSTEGQTETLTITAFTAGAASGVTLTKTVTVTFAQIPVGTVGSTVTANPTSLTADGSSSSTVTVTVLDQLGKAVPNVNVTFTVNAGNNVTLTPATPVMTSASGTATVSVTSKTAQSGVTINAVIALPGSASTAVTLTSPAITFVPGPASALSFGAMPAATAGEPFALVVNFVDANGNVTSTNQEVVLSDPNNPVVANAPLEGPFNPSSGVVATAFATPLAGMTVSSGGTATFTGLKQTTAGTYTVTARAVGVASARGTFNIGPNYAKQVIFLNGPSGAADNTVGQASSCVSGMPFNPAIQAAQADIFGNVCPNAPPITITLTNNGSASYNLTGTVSMATVNGVATFPQTGANALTPVAVGAPPVGGLTLLAAYTITNPRFGSPGNTLSNTVASGTFGLTTATNACRMVIRVAGGGAIPTSFVAGTSSVNLEVALFDNSQPPVLATALNAISNITIGATANDHGKGTGIVVSGGPVNISAGQSVSNPFTLSFKHTSSGAFLLASGASDGAVPLLGFANPLSVTPGPPTALNVGPAVDTNNSSVGVPSDLTPGQGNMGLGGNIALTVTVNDQFGNIATMFTGSVSVSLSPLGTLPVGAVVNGGAAIPVPSGIATFNVNVTGATGSGVVLRAGTTEAGVNFNDSGAFNLLAPGTAAALQFVSGFQPTTTVAGAMINAPNEVRVRVVDVTGAAIALAGIPVKLAFLDNTGFEANGKSFPGTTTLLAGTVTANTDATGLARFTNLSVTGSLSAGVSYQLLAVSSNLTNAASAPFDIVPGQPDPTVAPTIFEDVGHSFVAVPTGTLIALSNGVNSIPVLQVLDLQGNVATTFHGLCTVTFEVGTPTSTPFGVFTAGSTTTVPFVGGNAVFDNLAIGGPAATGYQLHFATGGLTPIASAITFDTQ